MATDDLADRARERAIANAVHRWLAQPGGPSMFAIHLKAPNTPSGNPRRLYLICNHHGPLAAVDEGYSGVGAMREEGYPDVPVVWDIDVSPGTYKQTLKRLAPGSRRGRR